VKDAKTSKDGKITQDILKRLNIPGFQKRKRLCNIARKVFRCKDYKRKKDYAR
jgi:hypothetical protein